MDTTITKSARDSMSALVSASISKENASSLSGMLQTLAGEAEAIGCVIWAAAPLPDSPGDEPGWRLAALGQWFTDGHLCHSRPPLASVIGATIKGRRTVLVEDVASEPRLYIDAEFFNRTGIKSMLSVSVDCGNDDCWAVSFFRADGAPFAIEEVARIESMVTVIPALYQAIRSKSRVAVLRGIEKITGRAEIRQASRVPLNHRVRRDIFQLCKEITSAFNCSETSIFLRDSLSPSSKPRLAATTWRRGTTKGETGVAPGDKLGHWLAELSGSTLAPDASLPEVFGQDRDNYLPEYDGQYRHRFGNGDGLPSNGADKEVPTSGAVALPITAGGEVLGYLVCRTLTADDPDSAKSDLEFLRWVANRIGYYWVNWLRRCAAHGEVLDWQNLNKRLGELDKFVLDMLARTEDAERLICAKALQVVTAVVSGADVLAVRKVNEEAREFCFLEVHGEGWPTGTPDQVNSRKRAIPLAAAAPPRGRGRALSTDNVNLAAGDAVDRFYHQTFPGISRKISAPIFVGDNNYGWLDMCSTGQTPLSTYAPAVAEMICQKLGSYKHLAETMGQLWQANTELSSLVQIHSQFHEDLAHQLKSPIFQAHLRVQKALRHKGLDDKLKQQLQAVRGLCGKASKVTMSTKLFAALARGEKFQPNLSPLWHDDLMKMLIEAATDSELVASPMRRIRFCVNREPMGSLPTNRSLVRVDNDLLQQAIANLLDNAGKYSYDNTVVRISASIDNSGHFFISVINEGLTINAEDVANCIQRHWRGEKASLTTGEGSGIGLWIVHHIMIAHGGRLVINPTTSNQLTEVKLVFH